MKQSLARILIFISLILSLTSFVLSLMAYYLPYWKFVQLSSTYTPMLSSDSSPIDPLVRGEVDKYLEILYRRGETHSFGLVSHCTSDGKCGQNALPSFHENDYGLCHNINSHRQCIFPDVLASNHNPKCTCQSPSYVKIINKLLLVLILLQILFFLWNILRLTRHNCSKYCLNDIQLRLLALISALFIFIFLLIIITQYNSNRLHEPLEFLESMRRHYSRIQIYAFSKDLEVIIEQIVNSLEIRHGASFICIIIVFLLTLIAFFASISVEIKIFSAPSSLPVNNEKDDNKKLFHYGNHENHLPRPMITTTERFVPSEHIRYARQTKV